MYKGRIILILGIILVLGIVGGGSYFLFGNSQQPSGQPVQPILSPTSDPPFIETTQWIDQSEFRFDYPKNLTLNPHDEDKENYAHVELTSSEHPGYLIVWAKDTTAQTIEDWLKKENIQGAIDTTFSGLPAKKELVAGEADKIITSAIRNGYLYQIETRLVDKEYWSKIYDGVASSFTFISSAEYTNGTPQTDSPSSDSAGDFVEEETIE